MASSSSDGWRQPWIKYRNMPYFWFKWCEPF